MNIQIVRILPISLSKLKTYNHAKENWVYRKGWSQIRVS